MRSLPKEEIVGFINEYLSGERGKAEKEQSDGRKQDGSAGGESKGNADAESGTHNAVVSKMLGQEKTP